jgi:predicted nucleic acid-binding protein
MDTWTNYKLYFPGHNVFCPEHSPCRALLENALATPDSWIIADQVWYERYRLLRNPAVETQKG